MTTFKLLLTIACGQLAVIPALKINRHPTAKVEHFEVMPKPQLAGFDGMYDMWVQWSQGFMKSIPKENFAGLPQKATENPFALPGAKETKDNSFRLLNMNTWYGGNMVPGGLGMIANAIIQADPHVVVLQEIPDARGLQSALAAMGKMYMVQPGAGDTALLSKWPIMNVESVPGTADSIVAYHLKAPAADSGDMSVFAYERDLIVAAAHLDWQHYAPALVRGYDPNSFTTNSYQELGAPVTDVQRILQEEFTSGRGAAIDAFLAWKNSLPPTTSVVIAGDFNAPSHLDWTPSTAHDFDHNGAVVPWPHSSKLASAGFIDSWRQMHPDPKSRPGHTFPSAAFSLANTAWSPKADERDRIDYVYHSGIFETAHAALLGSSLYHVKGQVTRSSDQFFLEHLPWPSDHKGLYVEFKLKPEMKREAHHIDYSMNPDGTIHINKGADNIKR